LDGREPAANTMLAGLIAETGGAARSPAEAGAARRAGGTGSRAPAGLRVELTGRVQGVGFRPWVYALARASGIRGRVFNTGSSVTVEAFGDAAALDAFAHRLSSPPMPAAAVLEARVTPVPAEAAGSFEILASVPGPGRRPSIPPDLTICEDCRPELLDPADPRYRYLFGFETGGVVRLDLRALGGREVHRPGEVPPGDGGIALGQALVADGVARRAS